jgi:hypothetical protein
MALRFDLLRIPETDVVFYTCGKALRSVPPRGGNSCQPYRIVKKTVTPIKVAERRN